MVPLDLGTQCLFDPVRRGKGHHGVKNSTLVESRGTGADSTPKDKVGVEVLRFERTFYNSYTGLRFVGT